MADYRDLLKVSRPGVPEIVALSVDTPERAARLRADLALPFRLLCDPEKKVITEWDLLDPSKGGVARSATFGMDRHRTVVFRSLDATMMRATGEQALKAVLDPPKEPRLEKRSWVWPSAGQLLRSVYYMFRYGLGAPRPYTR